MSAYEAATGSWVTITVVCPMIVDAATATAAASRARHAVQRARRLVGEQHRGLGDQRPRDRHALLLATRQGAGRCSPGPRAPPAKRQPHAVPRDLAPARRSGSATFSAALR